MFFKKIKPSFLLLLFIAFMVRLMSQAGKPFWLDEAISWSFARQDLPNLLAATAADNHPPFYYVFLHFWMKLGQSEPFLRFPSIIFGLIAIYLVYLIGKKIAGDKIGVFASALIAFSPLHVYFSAETRMYSLWTLEILTTLYVFLKILEKPKTIYYLLFAICSLLALYTHYFSLLYFLSLDLFLIFHLKKYQKQFKGLITSQIIAGLLFLPWLLFILHNPHPQPWVIPLITAVPATYLSFVLGGLGATTLKTFFAPSTPLAIKGFFTAVSLYFLVFAILGVLKKIKDEIRLIILFFLFFPVFLTIFISLFKPLYSPRSFIIFSPFFYFLIALGLEKIKNPLRGWLKSTTITLLGIILLIQNFYPPFKPQALKEAADFIKKNSTSSVIVHSDILTFYPFQYYFREDKVSQFLIFPSGLTPKTTDIIDGSPVSLQKAAEARQPFWSVAYTWDEKTWRFKDEQLKLNDKFSYNLTRTINDLEIFYHHPRQSTSSPLPR